LESGGGREGETGLRLWPLWPSDSTRGGACRGARRRRGLGGRWPRVGWRGTTPRGPSGGHRHRWCGAVNGVGKPGPAASGRGMFRMPRRRERWRGAAWAGFACADAAVTVANGGRARDGRMGSGRTPQASGDGDRARRRGTAVSHRRWGGGWRFEAGKRGGAGTRGRRAGPATHAASLISPQATATNGARAGPPQRPRLPVRENRRKIVVVQRVLPAYHCCNAKGTVPKHNFTRHLACQLISQQYFSFTLNQHQPLAVSQPVVFFSHNKLTTTTSHNQTNKLIGSTTSAWTCTCSSPCLVCSVKVFAKTFCPFDH